MKKWRSMKKQFGVILGLCFVLGLSACGNYAAQEEKAESQETVQANLEENDIEVEETENAEDASELDIQSGVTEITMTAGDTVITAELDNSVTTQEFLATLPRTITMNRYGDREYYGRMEELTEDGEVIEDFENGDVTYFTGGPSFAIFFAGADSSSQGGLIRLGRITSDLTVFDTLGESTEMQIEVAE